MSSFGPRFFSEPWGLLLLTESEGSRGTSPEEVCGRGAPRVITEFSQPVKWSGGLGMAPIASLPFIWANRLCASWHLPCSHQPGPGEQSLTHLWTLPVTQGAGSLTQKGVLARAPTGEIAPDAASQSLDGFISWLVNSFQELAHMKLEGADASAGGLVRRSWERAHAVWLAPDSAEPRIELIIKMAQDGPLLKTLESISRNPRRILFRVRQNTPLARVKEMDAACIRHFARQPGRTAIEKAGTRQMLMAVQRNASHNTLENKVTAWTLGNLRRRAEQWRRLQSDKARGSQRHRSVAGLAKHAARFAASETLGDVSYQALSHPVAANYPLMMDPRYERVYKAYRELLKYQKITDEAWTWRRALWAEGVGQLLSCSLRKIWPTRNGSTPFYRTEPDRGRWMVAPCAAGPFVTPRGLMHVVDFHDLEELPEAALRDFLRGQGALGSIGALGCETALWWPQQNSFVAVWSLLWTGDYVGWSQQLGRAAAALVRFREALHREKISVGQLSGIVLGTTTDGTDIELDEGSAANSRVTGIRFPMRIDSQDVHAFGSIIENLKAGIELSFGDLKK